MSTPRATVMLSACGDDASDCCHPEGVFASLQIIEGKLYSICCYCKRAREASIRTQHIVRTAFPRILAAAGGGGETDRNADPTGVLDEDGRRILTPWAVEREAGEPPARAAALAPEIVGRMESEEFSVAESRDLVEALHYAVKCALDRAQVHVQDEARAARDSVVVSVIGRPLADFRRGPL